MKMAWKKEHTPTFWLLCNNGIPLHLVFFTLLLIPLSTLAQPDQLPLTKIKSNDREQVKPYFNSSTVRLYRVGPVVSTGLFILYEKADTLDFNHAFYQVDTPFNDLGSTSHDYILEGLAYYEKEGDVYKKRFANDIAFPCLDCDNMGNHDMVARGDTVVLSFSWGPRFDWDDEYTFVYRPSIKRWQITTAFSTAGFYRDYNNQYVEFDEKTQLFLNNIDTDGFPFDQDTLNTAYGISLSYTSGNYAELLKNLKRIPPQRYHLIGKVFTADDAQSFTTDKEGNNNMTSSNVVTAGRIGYFLEQANQFNTAAIFLDSVIAKFPERETAWLHLADVYRKQHINSKALKAYGTYIQLMKEKKMETKIPQRVKAFIQEATK